MPSIRAGSAILLLALGLLSAAAATSRAQTAACPTLRQRTVGTLTDDASGIGGYTLYAPTRLSTT